MGGMKTERRRTMEVGRRLTFSTTACQINGMSVELAPSLPRGNPRVHLREEKEGMLEDVCCKG